MISSKDVMIGCWVEYMGFKVVVREIFAKDVFTLGKKEKDGVDIEGQKLGQNLGGIRLTEQIFEKIGFTKYENEFRLQIDDVTYIILEPFSETSFNIHQRIVYPTGHYQDLAYEIPIAFLHEFQMRYFGITGTHKHFVI